MLCAHGRFLEIWLPNSGTVQVFCSFSLDFLYPNICFLIYSQLNTLNENVQKLAKKIRLKPNHFSLIRSFGGHEWTSWLSAVYGFTVVCAKMHGFLSYAKQTCTTSNCFILVIEFLSTRIKQEGISLWIHIIWILPSIDPLTTQET